MIWSRIVNTHIRSWTPKHLLHLHWKWQLFLSLLANVTTSTAWAVPLGAFQWHFLYLSLSNHKNGTGSVWRTRNWSEYRDEKKNQWFDMNNKNVKCTNEQKRSAPILTKILPCSKPYSQVVWKRSTKKNSNRANHYFAIMVRLNSEDEIMKQFRLIFD